MGGVGARASGIELQISLQKFLAEITKGYVKFSFFVNNLNELNFPNRNKAMYYITGTYSLSLVSFCSLTLNWIVKKFDLSINFYFEN